MLTVDEYQYKRKKELEDGLTHTGIACPKCQEETEMIQNATMILTMPPQKIVECPVCKHKEIVLA